MKKSLTYLEQIVEQGTVAGPLTKRRRNVRHSSSRSAGLGVGVLACHVVEEVVDVAEEVVVGEVVVGVCDEEASSRVERSPKTLSPFSRT